MGGRQLLAARMGGFFVDQNDHRSGLFDTATGKLIRELEFGPHPIFGMFSEDATRFVGVVRRDRRRVQRVPTVRPQDGQKNGRDQGESCRVLSGDFIRWAIRRLGRRYHGCSHSRWHNGQTRPHAPFGEENSPRKSAIQRRRVYFSPQRRTPDRRNCTSTTFLSAFERQRVDDVALTRVFDVASGKGKVEPLLHEPRNDKQELATL